MKNIFYILLLLPTIIFAQYPSNSGQKITLGEQTSADGLVYRGLATDTTRKPFVDTMAFILLDTNTNIIWQYKKAVNNAWTRVNLLPSDTTSFNYVNTYGTQTVNGAKSFTSAVTGARFNPTSSTATGTGMYLPAANTLGFSVNGIPQVRINPNGSTSFGPTTQNDFAFISYSEAQNIAEYIGKNNNNDLNNGGAFMRIINLSNINNTSRSIIFADSSKTAIGVIFSHLINTETKEGAFSIGLRNSSGSFGRRLYIKGNGEIGIGTTAPTAVLHLKAGTATASTAPFKFTSGTNLTTAEAGAMEFNGTNLFFSPSTTRHTVNHGLTGSATLNFPSTSANTYSDLTISVTGAALSDVVSLGIPNAAMSANNITYTAWVSAANTVTVRFANHTTGTVDPASGLFKVFVTK